MIKKTTLGEIIRDSQELRLPRLIERELGYPVKIPIKRAVAIIGPRRTGKTYSMFQLMKRLLAEGIEGERILYVNLEDSRLIAMEIGDLNALIEVFYEIYPENKERDVWILLDEIQVVPRWETFVRTLLDREKAYVYLSGSSSKLLSREIATCLRGRTLPYYVFPFSFNEFLKARELSFGKYLSSREKATLLNALKEFMEWGGYPEAVLYEEERKRIIGEIKEVTLYRDIVERHKVKNIKVLKIFFNQLFYSKEFSIHKFYNFLKSQGIKIGKNTLYNYFEYFYDSLVIFPLRKFSFSYRQIEQSIPKVYSVDNALLTPEGVRDYRRLMENFVFSELRKKGLLENKDIFYFKAPNGKEVDFILKENLKVKKLIQVCYNVEDYVTKERELKALIRASRELDCNDLLLITWDYEGEEEYKGKTIRFIPLWKWLLTA